MRFATLLAALCLLGFLGVLVLPGATAHAEPFSPGQTFNQALSAQVTGNALAFMAPRTLDEIPIPQMALWGLRGLAALDPRLAPDVREGSLQLAASARLLVNRPVPADADADGWGVATAQVERAAWDASDAVRRAGNAALTRSFFDELFNHFDPYSRYVPPGEAADDRLRRNGRAGIGATLGPTVGSGLVLQALQADGPAARAGVRPGDRLLAVDGERVDVADLSAARAMLDGGDGTSVTLLLQGRDRRPRAVELRRALIPSETVTATRSGEALVIRITGFASNTAERLASELTRGLAEPRPARGVVLDLRDNRGGLLRQAIVAADTLLTHGTVAVTVGRDPEADHEFVADGTDLAHGLPVVVVVDGRSASSAEILAAALADQGRAVIVGSATLGKGLVQTIVTLPDGGDLYVTWSRVLAPLGWPLQGLGVLPQVCTSLGEAALSDALGALDAGHQPMEHALLRHRDARAPITPAEVIDIRNACPAAEGRDSDMAAARYLLGHRAAYATALIRPPAP